MGGRRRTRSRHTALLYHQGQDGTTSPRTANAKHGDRGQPVQNELAATSDKVAGAEEPGCSMGSNAPVGETVSTAGRRGMIAADGWQRQKGFSGGKSRPAVMVGCSRPPSARKIVAFLKSVCAARLGSG